MFGIRRTLRAKVVRLWDYLMVLKVQRLFILSDPERGPRLVGIMMFPGFLFAFNHFGMYVEQKAQRTQKEIAAIRQRSEDEKRAMSLISGSK